MSIYESQGGGGLKWGSFLGREFYSTLEYGLKLTIIYKLHKLFKLLVIAYQRETKGKNHN